MNYLVHTYLSFGDPQLLMGNYLGDFVRNSDLPDLSPAISRGVTMHRAIDSFSDNHPTFRKGTRLLHQNLGKYAPVVLDIYFDFLLCKNWERWHPAQVSDHCQQTYDLLLQQKMDIPDRWRYRMERMIADRWLERYQTYEGLNGVFGFISKRARFSSSLDRATMYLIPLEKELDAIFQEFFPDLEAFVRSNFTQWQMP